MAGTRCTFWTGTDEGPGRIAPVATVGVAVPSDKRRRSPPTASPATNFRVEADPDTAAGTCSDYIRLRRATASQYRPLRRAPLSPECARRAGPKAEIRWGWKSLLRLLADGRRSGVPSASALQLWGR